MTNQISIYDDYVNATYDSHVEERGDNAVSKDEFREAALNHVIDNAIALQKDDEDKKLYMGDALEQLTNALNR